MLQEPIDEMIFENFKLYYPHFAELTERWEPSGKMEITVYLANGQMITYDDIENTFRQIRDFKSPINLEDEEKVADEFSYNLRRMLHHQRMTQLDLSEASGLSFVTISNYLNGKRSPTLKNICLLAKALDCRASDLINF